MIIAAPTVTQGKMLRTTSKIAIQDALRPILSTRDQDTDLTVERLQMFSRRLDSYSDSSILAMYNKVYIRNTSRFGSGHSKFVRENFKGESNNLKYQKVLCVLRYHLIKKSDSNLLLTEALRITLPDFFSKVSSFFTHTPMSGQKATQLLTLAKAINIKGCRDSGSGKFLEQFLKDNGAEDNQRPAITLDPAGLLVTRIRPKVRPKVTPEVIPEVIPEDTPLRQQGSPAVIELASSAQTSKPSPSSSRAATTGPTLNPDSMLVKPDSVLVQRSGDQVRVSKSAEVKKLGSHRVSKTSSSIMSHALLKKIAIRSAGSLLAFIPLLASNTTQIRLMSVMGAIGFNVAFSLMDMFYSCKSWFSKKEEVPAEQTAAETKKREQASPASVTLSGTATGGVSGSTRKEEVPAEQTAAATKKPVPASPASVTLSGTATGGVSGSTRKEEVSAEQTTATTKKPVPASPASVTVSGTATGGVSGSTKQEDVAEPQIAAATKMPVPESPASVTLSSPAPGVLSGRDKKEDLAEPQTAAATAMPSPASAPSSGYKLKKGDLSKITLFINSKPDFRSQFKRVVSGSKIGIVNAANTAVYKSGNGGIAKAIEDATGGICRTDWRSSTWTQASGIFSKNDVRQVYCADTTSTSADTRPYALPSASSRIKNGEAVLGHPGDLGKDGTKIVAIINAIGCQHGEMSILENAYYNTIQAAAAADLDTIVLTDISGNIFASGTTPAKRAKVAFDGISKGIQNFYIAKGKRAPKVIFNILGKPTGSAAQFMTELQTLASA